MKTEDRKRMNIINALRDTWQGIGPDLLGEQEEGNTLTGEQVQQAVVSCLHMAEETEPAAYKWFNNLPVSERQKILDEAFPDETYGW